MTGEPEIKIRFLVNVEDEAELGVLRGLAGKNGAEVEETRVRDLGPDTVVFLLGAPLIISVIVQDFLQRRHDQRLGGYLIDRSDGIPKLRRDLGAPVGKLTVLNPDGSVELYLLESTDRLANLLRTVLGAAAQSERPSPGDGDE